MQPRFVVFRWFARMRSLRKPQTAGRWIGNAGQGWHVVTCARFACSSLRSQPLMLDPAGRLRGAQPASNGLQSALSRAQARCDLRAYLRPREALERSLAHQINNDLDSLFLRNKEGPARSAQKVRIRALARHRRPARELAPPPVRRRRWWRTYANSRAGLGSARPSDSEVDDPCCFLPFSEIL